MTQILADCRYALRGLRKAPVFASVAVLSIALGIGANTAIFTLLDQVLLRLLPVADPHQLVLISPSGAFMGSQRGQNTLSYPMYVDLRDHGQVFSGAFARFPLAIHVGVKGRTERITGELVSGTYFPVLGVRAALGRTIAPDDDVLPGAHPVVVLSYSYWKSRFGSDPGAIGRTITINDHAMTIIGVAQDGFEGVDIADASRVFIPLMMKAQMTPQWNDLDNRRSRWLNVYGRLKPDVSLAKASAALLPFYRSRLELELAQPALSDASDRFRTRFRDGRIELLPGAQGQTALQDRVQTPLWVLMGIVGGVLLIACANVANLLLARAAARQREMAVRLALGASRRRIVQQLLVESVVLAAIGGVLGLLVATWGARLLVAFFAGEEGVVVTASPDARILAFNTAISLATGLVFGIVPALRSTRPALAPTLKDQAGSVLGGGQVRLRKALVVVQVALSLLLLIGAGLFLRSLTNLMSLDTGLKVESLIAFSIDPALNGYAPERRKQLFADLRDRLSATPGVSAAAFSAQTLLADDRWRATVRVEGYESKPDEDMNPFLNAVSPDFFATVGMRLLAGRDFSAQDRRSDTASAAKRESQFRVAIVNEAFAKQFFAGRSAVGGRFGEGRNPRNRPTEIIGVVSNAKYANMREEIPRQVYYPFLEDDDPASATLYVRTARDPEALFQTVRQIVQQIDPNLPIFGMRTVEAQVARSLMNERLVASLSSVFSVLATLLAMIGLYGVMAYTVARRTREIGIRMALGAPAHNVAWLILREVALLVAIGVALALPAAWGVSQYVRSQLYGITPNDPQTVAIAIVGLVAVAAIAGLIPARRAARVNPLTALRYE